MSMNFSIFKFVLPYKGTPSDWKNLEAKVSVKNKRFLWNDFLVKNTASDRNDSIGARAQNKQTNRLQSRRARARAVAAQLKSKSTSLQQTRQFRCGTAGSGGSSRSRRITTWPNGTRVPGMRGKSRLNYQARL